MHLADLIAPIPLSRFEAEIFGKRPLHIPADTRGAAKAPFGWPGMNAVLGLASHWSEANLKLIMNSRPVEPGFYIDEVSTLGGVMRRANPAKVNLFLAMGASLVANSLEEISPEVRAATAALGDHFHARVGANAYCSFGGIQAFASHCDLHEVFAVQCEGEKVWSIYENRADAPVESPDGPEAQAIIDSAKGGVLTQVQMRPGDVLYIPRGYYHDALANADASLHVTFSVALLTGRALFRLLEEVAMEDPAFREYLPDARLDEGRQLAQRLERLACGVAELLRSDRFASELELRQRKLAKPDPGFGLPERQALEFFARSERKAELKQDEAGTIVATAQGRYPIGYLSEPTRWLLGRPGFSLQELFVQFHPIEQGALRELVGGMQELGLVFPYRPKLE
jgi:lysine-specific demethylase/histidyl-hydroxylase NO66